MRLGLAATLAIGLVGRSAAAGDEDPPPRLVAQYGVTSQSKAVAFSPDGRLVLTASVAPIIWETATGRELRRFPVPGPGTLLHAAFSYDGRRVVTADNAGVVRVWDVRNGKEIRNFSHPRGPRLVAFSPDGLWILTGGDDDGTAHLWRTADGKAVRSFEGHTKQVAAVAISPHGRWCLTGSYDNTARLWDLATGKTAHVLRRHMSAVISVAFLPDSRRIMTATNDGEARIWEVASGKEVRCFTAGSIFVAAAFSRDGGRLLAGLNDGTARIWDIASGDEVWRIQMPGSGASVVAFSPDGRWVLTGVPNDAVRLWEAATGRHVRSFGYVGTWFPDYKLAVSPDGRQILQGGRRARLWDLAAGTLARRIEGPSNWIEYVGFSRDGRRIVTDGADGTVRVWDSDSGKEMDRLEGCWWNIRSIAYSPDGRQVFMSGSIAPDGKLSERRRSVGVVRIQELDTLRDVRRFRGGSGRITPDWRWAVTTQWTDGSAVLWDVATGKPVRRFEPLVRNMAHGLSPDGRWIVGVATLGAGLGQVRFTVGVWKSTGTLAHRIPLRASRCRLAAFSPDSRWILMLDDAHVRLVELATGREIRCFDGSLPVKDAKFSPDGRWIVVGYETGALRLWETATGKLLCRLYAFPSGAWAIVDVDGRYDASNGGDIERLHWVVGDETVELAQLKERYYDPGLLGKHLGFNKEPLRQVKAFARPRLFPSCKLTPPTAENPTLGVHLQDRGGGIGRVSVKINGKELTADARAPGTDPGAGKLSLEVSLANDPRLIPGRANTIEVEAYNAEGYLRSRGIRLTYTPPGRRRDAAPALWAILAGVADYAGDAIDLRYAAKDAKDLAVGLRPAAERLFGTDKAHVTYLGDPKRTELVDALKDARRARPEDVLVLYLAGHGVNHGGEEGDFYFLTREARSANLDDPAVRRSVAVSSRELTELIKAVPALKQVLILDTCGAGRLIEKITEVRSVPSSQVRAIERLKDRTGLHVLAGCAADRVSYETSQYAQGLLTHSLLLGMRGAALRDEEYVDVARLFSFAVDRVPELARGIGGIQRPLVATPKGGASFDIGRLTEQDRPKVPLRTAKPLIVRTNLQDEAAFEDLLGLARRVDEQLHAESGRDGPFAFVDTRTFPEAYRIAGRYRVEGARVTAEIRLFRGRTEQARLSVTGAKADLDAFAGKIVDEVRKQLKLRTQGVR